MEKQVFYSEHLQYNDYYRLVAEKPDPEIFEDVFTGLYDNARVSLARFPASGGLIESLSMPTANHILKNVAGTLGDKEKACFTVIADWKALDKRKGDSCFVTRVELTNKDRENDHIIEKCMVDRFIAEYDKKLENPKHHSFSLSRMMQLPEVYARLMEESHEFVQAHAKDLDRGYNYDASRGNDVSEVWMSTEIGSSKSKRLGNGR